VGFPQLFKGTPRAVPDTTYRCLARKRKGGKRAGPAWAGLHAREEEADGLGWFTGRKKKEREREKKWAGWRKREREEREKVFPFFLFNFFSNSFFKLSNFNQIEIHAFET
jgi:hypothetical protein